jgi:hypothetical protein
MNGASEFTATIDLESSPVKVKRERKGPVAEQREVRAGHGQSALIYPMSLRDTGPFLPPQAVEDD